MGVPTCKNNAARSKDQYTLKEIIDLQLVSGAFQWDIILECVLSIRKADVIKAAKRNGGIEVWVTALVMAYLKIKVPTSKNLWELVVEKATKFLEGACGGELQKILEKAEVVIKSERSKKGKNHF